MIFSAKRGGSGPEVTEPPRFRVENFTHQTDTNMQNIFDRDFYPTPKAVVEKMLEGIDVAGKIVLEPSAGTGNIVDVLKDYGAREVLSCEINDKWRDILQNKCTVIGTDFLKLTAENVAGIDLIDPHERFWICKSIFPNLPWDMRRFMRERWSKGVRRQGNGCITFVFPAQR